MRAEDDVGLAGASVINLNSDAGELLGVRVGMTESQLVALGYPVLVSSTIDEGDEYRVIHVTVVDGVALDAVIASGTLHRFIVTSPRVRDESGFGVGSTLAELEDKYPNGQLFVGYEGVKHANFTAGSKVIFRLDMGQIEERCFDYASKGGECVGAGVRVESLVVDAAASREQESK